MTVIANTQEITAELPPESVNIILDSADKSPEKTVAAIIDDTIARNANGKRRKHKQPSSAAKPLDLFTPEGFKFKNDVYCVWFCTELTQERRDRYISEQLCSPILLEAKLIQQGLRTNTNCRNRSEIFNKVMLEIFKSVKPELVNNNQ